MKPLPTGENFPVWPVLVGLALSVVVCQPAHAAIPESQIPELVQTIVRAESSGRPWVTGDNGKARGLMQIQRGTWEQHTKKPWSRAFDARTTLTVGEKHGRYIIRRHGKKATPARVLFIYNTGRFLKIGRLPRWTRKHPNKIYRAIFAQEVVGRSA